MMVGIILVPIYLVYIPKDLYGYWLATGNILTIISLLDPGIGGVVTQKVSYYYGKMDCRSVGCYSFNGVLLSVIIALLVFIVGILLSEKISLFLNVPYEYQEELINAFNYTLTGTSLMIIYYSIGTIAYGMLSSKCIGFINLFANISGLILTVVFFRLEYGLLSIGYASLIRSIIYILGSILYITYRFVNEKIGFSFDLLLMKDFFKLSFYNFFGSLGQNLLSNMNSFICTKYISPIASANLRFSQTVPDMGKTVALRIVSSFAPSISNLYGANQKKQLKTMIFLLTQILVWLLGLVFVGFLFLNESFILIWIGANNYCGGISNFLIIVLLMLSTVNKTISLIIFNLGDIKINNLVLFFQAVLYFALIIPIALYFKINGILLLSIGIEFLAFYFYYGRKIINIFDCKDDVKKIYQNIFQTILVCAFVYIVLLVIDYFPTNWISFLMIVLFISLFYTLCLCLISVAFRQACFKFILRFR